VTLTVHQIRSSPGLRPGLRWRRSRRSPRLPPHSPPCRRLYTGGMLRKLEGNRRHWITFFIACKSISMAVHAFLMRFYTVLIIEKKLAPSLRKCAILTLKYQQKIVEKRDCFFPDPSPVGKGTPRPHTLFLLAPSALDIGFLTSIPVFCFFLYSVKLLPNYFGPG